METTVLNEQVLGKIRKWQNVEYWNKAYEIGGKFHHKKQQASECFRVASELSSTGGDKEIIGQIRENARQHQRDAESYRLIVLNLNRELLDIRNYVSKTAPSLLTLVLQGRNGFLEELPPPEESTIIHYAKSMCEAELKLIEILD